MTAEQFRKIIEELGWTQGGAAEKLGVSIRTTHSYANGGKIPEPTARLLQSLHAKRSKRRKAA